MARHIMAVCVVCLLCADHLPCQEHLIDDIMSAATSNERRASVEYQPLNARVLQRIDSPAGTSSDDSAHPDSSSGTTNDKHYAHQRRKRHAGHAHTNAAPRRPQITDDFLQRLFEEYGQGDGTLRIGEFQRMLKQLGLHQLVEQQLDRHGNESCIADTMLVQHVQPHDLSHHQDDHQHRTANCSADTRDAGVGKSCAQIERQDEEQEEQKLHKSNYTVNTQDMLYLCPVLLYELASPLAAKRAGCIEQAWLQRIDDCESTQFHAVKEDMMYVWIYAFISVFACGILGLVGVAIIPFMDSRYYKHIIQFLVSLAVGTMTGDALLHLLPHSLAGQSERNIILKGLTCMSGIIFFYITEHGLTMISEWRKRIAKSETKQPARAKVLRDTDSSINNSVTGGDKVCKAKYSSYPYCYDEIAMDTKNDIHLPPTAKRNNIAEMGGDGLAIGNNVCAERKRNGKSDADGSEAVAQSLLPLWHHHREQQPQQQRHHHIHLPDSNTISTDLDGNAMGDGLTLDGATVTTVATNGNSNNSGNGNGKDKPLINDTVTVILREHESSHHGHSHKHGHVHSPPESLSAVVWMIIMGDGLHNFTDGMAIGAAFAENIAGGFSTSLAVFCHELPHELGDFAILIKAGMSIKTAVYYNLLTSVLSFVGMIVGIVFGQSPDVAQWMFAAAAGLFIYIALVDMMPELSSSHKSLQQFVLQVLGMCTGVLIMLLIAIYEGDLLTLFAASSSSALIGPPQHVH